MKVFNPEKELRKIQHGNKNKILLFVFLLLIVSVISYSLALYQVRYTKRIIYTKVAPFSNKDINLAVYVDNNKEEHFPEKNSGYRYDHIYCDNDSIATFDKIKWELTLTAKDKEKCDVYFVTTYKDASGANAPELYQGLIPVTISDTGEIKVANIDSQWYSYNDHNWANAVLVTSAKYSNYVEDGKYKSDTIVEMSDILQMYVWIPRYKYELFNVNNDVIDEKEIKIEFENNVTTTGSVTCTTNNLGVETCDNAANGNWYTHPAFTFGDTELTGIWVGKFETSGTTTDLKILPNLTPMTNFNIGTMFNSSRNIENSYANKYNLNSNEIDTHMMKNMEWGAVAYLTQSKYARCTNGECSEVSQNATEYKTGYAKSTEQWNSENGKLASTTGNVYGIYDMNGGALEYVMGNMVSSSGAYQKGSSGLNQPEEKYYDKYAYSSTAYDYERGHLGDATREILKSRDLGGYGGWYSDRLSLPSGSTQWFYRSERTTYATHCGVFAAGSLAGEVRAYSVSFRVIISAQDNS